MMWLLFVMWLFTFAFLFLAARRIETLQQEIQDERAAHDSCHTNVADAFVMVSDHLEARTLRQAADDWDSIEEQGNLRRLANEQYQAGGPSMPVLWLRDRAAKKIEKYDTPTERTEA